MGELSSLGLTPEVLHSLIGEAGTLVHTTEQPRLLLEDSNRLASEPFNISSVVYELNNGKSTRIEPQLRIWINIPPPTFIPSSKSASLVDSGDVVNGDGQDAAGSLYHNRLPWTSHQQTTSTDEGHTSEQGLSILAPARYVE